MFKVTDYFPARQHPMSDEKLSDTSLAPKYKVRDTKCFIFFTFLQSKMILGLYVIIKGSLAICTYEYHQELDTRLH